jgi:hypothetical protein
MNDFDSRAHRLDQDWREWNEQRVSAVKVWNTLKTTYKVSDFIGWQQNKTLKLNRA